MNIFFRISRFLMKLSNVENLEKKLKIMSFMLTFSDTFIKVNTWVETLYLASRSTKDATKFKKILELILTIGNYMNGNGKDKKPSSYGFKMSTLENLDRTKSTDKKSNLVNYLVDIVNTQFPDIKGFESELKSIEKASQLSLESIDNEVNQMNVKMTLVKSELENRQKNSEDMNNSGTSALKEFYENGNGLMIKLKEDADKSEAAFYECLEHFGEGKPTKDETPIIFFDNLNKFCESWEKAEQENIKRRKRELRLQGNKENVIDPSVHNATKNNMQLIAAELKNKSRKQINPDEIDVRFLT